MTHEIIHDIRYSFPATKWARTATAHEQKRHFHSEIHEYHISDPDTPQELEELIDVYHSLETYFRILERDGVDVAGAFCKVYKKNKVRGYYENLDTQTTEPETKVRD